MATKTFEELKQLAIQIRDEKTNKQNTATRVGTEMLEHLNKLEQDYYDKTKTDEELKKRDNKLTELDNKTSFAEYTDDSEFVYKIVDRDTGSIVFGIKKINEKFFLYPFGIEVDANFVCASKEQLDNVQKSTALTHIYEVNDDEYVYKILHDGNIVFGIKLIDGKYVIDGIESNITSVESFSYSDIDLQSENANIADYNEYNNISNCRSKIITLPSGYSSITIVSNKVINEQVSIPIKILQSEQIKISLAINAYNDEGVRVFNIDEFKLAEETGANNSLTGYNYYILGNIWQRINLDCNGKSIKKIVIVFNCTAESKMLIGEKIVVGHELDLTPVIIIHDGADYRCTFKYEGETVTVWKLYKKLNIPFCVAISSGAAICPEVNDLIAQGLCTVIGYTGSTKMTDNTIQERVDGVEKLINDGRCKASAAVISNAILEDEHLWVLERAGVRLTRAGLSRYNQSEIGLFSQYGNSSVIVAEGHLLTRPSRTTEYLKVPLCLWEHGIGTKSQHDTDNGYISNETEENIQRYINTIEYLISEQKEGRVAIMNVNDFINFLK